VPALGVQDATLEGSIRGENIHIESKHAIHPMVLEGALEDGILRSSRGPESFRSGFQFTRAVAPAPETHADYVGWYEWKTGEACLVSRGPEGGLRFSYLGRLFGLLLPLSRDTFQVAFIDAVPIPTTSKIRFLRDASGRVTALDMEGSKLKDGGRAPRLALPPMHQEEIAFENGTVELAGMLLAPADRRPHPAVVFIHGTGYQTSDRSYELTIAREFVRRGIVVLTFDKRGCGASGGDWQTASLEDLAGDVAAAVGVLRSRPEILPDRIGVYGISEGGWIAPAVAALSSTVSFVVNQGGPGVSPLEDEMDDLTSGVTQLGLDGEDRALAMAVAQSLVELYRSSEGLAGHRAALDAVRSRPWFAGVQARIPETEDDPRVQCWRKRGRFEALRYWQNLRVPALVLIGEKDATMDVPKNLGVFESVRRSNPHLEIRIVPKADHALRVTGNAATGFPADVAEWILRRE
jgi:pimeloyl-ACP methyl ester carboxylesterase